MEKQKNADSKLRSEASSLKNQIRMYIFLDIDSKAETSSREFEK